MTTRWIVLLACTSVLMGCGGTGAKNSSSGTGAVTQQVVFMWSPSGFGGPTGPQVDYEVALINLDGTGFRQLTNDGMQKFLPHISPDGTKVLYTKFLVGGFSSPDAVTEIAVLDLQSGQETLITTGGDNGYGTWSPDGSRIAYLQAARLGQATTDRTTIVTIGVDGSDPQIVDAASGAPDDWQWGDIAWSRENWILFVVGQQVNGSFCNSRVDKILPDGSQRTQVTNGGPDCTPPGKEAIGDADPGWSSDGTTIYSSYGLAASPAGLPSSSLVTERKLFAFSSDAWMAGKPESDLSLPQEPDCVEGVPKGSPDGEHILLFRMCYDNGAASQPGIYLTDTAGSYRTFITGGFGPDWNPAAAP